MECQTCNGKGYKRCGFLWLKKEDCPNCHGTGQRIVWPLHAIKSGRDQVGILAVDAQKSFLSHNAYSPVPKDLRTQTPDADAGPDLLATMAITSMVGGDPITAAVTAGLTGSELLGVGAGMLNQDDDLKDQPDEVDREQGESVEQADSSESNDVSDNDSYDSSDASSDSSDSSGCGSGD